jgi:hypothetical protein
MRHRILIWMVCPALSSLAADLKGLRQMSEVNITAQTVGAPFEGDKPPFLWALSFSPDGKTLAVGLQFSRKESEFKYTFRSYLLLIPADRPGVVLKQFETPSQGQLRNLHRTVWSANSRFLAITPWGDWDHSGAVDLESGQLHVFRDRMDVPWCGAAVAVLPGPQFVQQCSTARTFDRPVRFLELDGTTSSAWTFPPGAYLMEVSPDGRMLAVDFIGPSGKYPLLSPHDIALFNIADRSTVRRWSLPEAGGYAGTFANTGTAFCTVSNPNVVGPKHEIACRDIASGEMRSKLHLGRGTVTVRAAGDKLVLHYSNVVLFPFSIFGTSFVFTHDDVSIVDPQTGRALSQWRIPWGDDSNTSYAVSQSGDLVAIGEAGRIRIFSVTQ